MTEWIEIKDDMNKNNLPEEGEVVLVENNHGAIDLAIYAPLENNKTRFLIQRNKKAKVWWPKYFLKIPKNNKKKKASDPINS